MLDIPKLTELIQTRELHGDVDYTSNVYSAEPPEGGLPASRLDTDFAWLNQSAWVYDPLYQSWWRYVDTSDPQLAGKLHPEIDRLTNRQLHVENVIILKTAHDVVSPTNLDIHLESGLMGDAFLFRDGKQYKIRWSTHKTEAEKKANIRHPIRFYYEDTESLIPLKPGHTWVIIVTPFTALTEKQPGEWLMQFSQPPGAK